MSARKSLLAFAAGLMAVSATAAPLPVVNPGFENITGAQITSNEFTFGSLPGWTVYDEDNVANGGIGGTYYAGTLTPQILPAHDPVNYQNFPAGAPEGQRVGIAFNFAGAEPGHEYGLQQTLVGTSLLANTRYELQVLIGNIASGWSVSNGFFTLSGFPGYRVDLLAGNTLLASDDNSLAGTIPDGQWGESTVIFTTTDFHDALGQDLRIRLVNLNLVDGDFENADREVDFDNVRLSATAVPEPGTVALVLLAGAAFAVRRKR